MTPEQEEMRSERRAIMAAEKVPQIDIDAVFKQFPQIYGIAEYEEHQDGIFAETVKQAL